MHLTTIFRYKVTDNKNISGTTSKKFLSHVNTKNELTNYLGEKAITNFKNVNGDYAGSYATKCISNLENFTQEMMTNYHEEANTLLLLHAADVSQETLSQSFTYTPLILMYFFLLFTSIQYFVQIQHLRLAAANQ